MPAILFHMHQLHCPSPTQVEICCYFLAMFLTGEDINPGMHHWHSGNKGTVSMMRLKKDISCFKLLTGCGITEVLHIGKG